MMKTRLASTAPPTISDEELKEEALLFNDPQPLLGPDQWWATAISICVGRWFIWLIVINLV